MKNFFKLMEEDINIITRKLRVFPFLFPTIPIACKKYLCNKPVRTGIKYKMCNCYYCNNTFNCNSIQNDKPIKDLHADNSLASFATNRISSTRCITTKHDKRFLSILLKITQF